MISDRLYELAFKYKNSKLWKKLSDSDVFAVKLSDGETGYCCVMGMGGDYTALALYLGAEGWNSYRIMAETEQEPEFLEMHEIFQSQDCLHCSFEGREELLPEDADAVRDYARRNGIALRGRNAYPNFTRFRPGYLPWDLSDEAEADRMAQALEAALEVARRIEEMETRRNEAPVRLLLRASMKELGFNGIQEGGSIPLLEAKRGKYRWSLTQLPPPPPAAEYARPRLANEILLERIRRGQKTGTWECAVTRMPFPVQIDDNSAPCLPVIVLMAEKESGFALPPSSVGRYPEDADKLLDDIASSMVKQGSFPKAMAPRDRRTAAFFEEFCSQTGISLAEGEDTPTLDYIQEDMMRHLSRKATMGQLFDDDDDDDNDDDGEMAHMLRALLTAGPDKLKELPAPLLRNLSNMLDTGILPSSLERDLKKTLRDLKQ